MRLAYVTRYDPFDVKNAWSGTGYFILTTLRRCGFDVEPIGPLRYPLRPSVIGRRAFYRYLARQNYLWPESPPIARGMAAEVARVLDSGRFDVVFAPDLVPVAYLEGDWPLVTWIDATFPNLLDFHPRYSTTTIARVSVRDAMNLHSRAIARASACLFASDWAAASAIEDFGADPDKVHVIPFGANLVGLPTKAEVDDDISQRPRDRCSLLFVGVDWERKGGSTALEIAEALNRAGLPTKLTIVGRAPRIPERFAGFVEVRGYLDKQAGGMKELSSLYKRSHFLVHPARVEAYGIVHCEANAFGVPTLSTAIGGVPTVVRAGFSGMLFEPDAPPETYTASILRLFDDYGTYVRLARLSRREFDKRLNWDVVGASLKSLLESL